MSLPTQARQWQLANKPTHHVSISSSDSGPPTFKLVTVPIPSPIPAGSVLLKTLYLSNDPAQRTWINSSVDPSRMYLPPVEIGEAMRARGLAEVLQVGEGAKAQGSDVRTGDLVLAGTNWSDYCVLPGKECRVVQPLPKEAAASPSVFLGALGTTGLTAYYGLLEVARTKAEDIVVVSGAAGATGSMVVQIAKHMVGCKKVIGIAGGEDKCRWVVDRLGADACVDYKSDKSLADELKRVVGDTGVDVYFDNVGAETLDAMLALMNRHGRVAACGAISRYNSSEATSLTNWFEVISNRIEIKGFIVLDYLHKAQEAIGKMAEAAKAGKIRVGEEMETVVEGRLEDVPKVWTKLFEGANRGKLITKLV